MRRSLTIAAVFAALAAAASSSAVALEEQKAAAPPPGADAAPQAGVQDAAAPAKAGSGTEVRIPGFGKLGTLPKMDFGLELLYGAADAKAPSDAGPAVEETPEDLTIRGSVKHRF